MLTRSIFYYSKIILCFVLAVLMMTDPTLAQRIKPTKAQGSPTKQCSGVWSGTVSYKRTLKTSYEEGTSDFAKRNFVGAKSSKTTSRELTITGRIVLDGKPDPAIPQFGSSVGGQFFGATSQTGRTNVSVLEKETHQSSNLRRDSCGGNVTRDQTCQSSGSSLAEASASAEDSFGLVFQGGTYGFNFRLPEVRGTKTVKNQSSCKGFCQARNNSNTNTSEEVPVRYDKEPVSVKNQKYDEKNADRLQGSVTETSTDGKTITTITWNLRRCAPPLQIIDLRFEHEIFPTPDVWATVDEKNGTIDGNRVKIKATVFNSTPSERSVTVNFKELKSNLQLPDGSVTETIPGGESKEVELIWDTNGYAWNDAGAPESAREIKAEIADDSVTEKIKVIPKPVILAHGLWSNASAWSEWKGYLREAHTFAWDAFAVGEDPSVAKMNTGDHPGNDAPTNTVYQNAQELGKQVKWVREHKNAWHVDVVAHSMGGLITRRYIDTMMPQVADGKPAISHLVMLGTPNMGSPCADLVGSVFEFFGEKNMHAMRELRPSVVADFNKQVTARRNVKFSILIGWAVPFTCHHQIIGDGVVEIASAKYNIADHGFAFRDHVSLTNQDQFKGFVLPRLAIGPKKARSEGSMAWLESIGNDNLAMNESGSIFELASFVKPHRTQDPENASFTAREKVTLKAGEMKEISIPTSSGKTGVIIVAPSIVSGTLSDGKGMLLGKSSAGADAEKTPFRTIVAEKTVQGETLRLKLENSGSGEVIVYVGGFAIEAQSSNLSVEAGRPNAAGVVTLRAKWIENGSPVLRAKVTASMGAGFSVIELFDDGKHGDGTANDGIYGGVTEKLKAGDYLVNAEAEAQNKKASAETFFKIGK